MVCKENYSKSVKVYERQLRREIQQIIDNQSTAREATYFVRYISLYLYRLLHSFESFF